MANWKYTVNLKTVWDNYTELDHEDFDNDVDLFVTMKSEIIGEIKKQMKPGDLNELSDVLKGLETARQLSSFNRYFARLYDFCDYKKIWLKTLF